MVSQFHNMLDAALRYAELGYRVFPCRPGTKKPLTDNGFHDGTTDAEQIEAWWGQRPNANIGIATEGLVIIDVEAAGEGWLADDPDKQLELAAGPTALTAGGGRHYYFRQPDGRAWGGTAGGLAPHVDTRGDGGYVVVPPSVLEGGKAYTWVPGSELDVTPGALPEPPAWLVEELDRLAARGPTSPRVAASGGGANQIPSGQRNATLARLAGTMRRVGMAEAEIRTALHRANADRCDPPLAEAEVERIAASVGRYEPDQVSVALVEDHFGQMYGGDRAPVRPAPELRFEAITSKELAENEYELTYLVDGVLVRGQPGVIAGPKKSLKTNISVDLALALSQAGLFLGRFNVPEAVRVGVMSGESGAATIQETAKRIAATKHWSLEYFDDVVWSFTVPQLGNVDHTEALREFITGYELDVLILDPTYLMMMAIGQDAGNLFIVGSFLKALGELAQETGCTPLLCHHLKKNVAEPYEPAELENIAWAGFQEFIRQWILLNRRVKYDPDNGGHHELWMTVGGSAGHSGLWGVNVDEGTRQDAGGRRWEVEILAAAQAYAERAEAERDAAELRRERRRESKHDEDRDAVLKAFTLYPDGETKNTLREAAGFSGNRFGPILAELVEEGTVEQCTIVKSNGQTYSGYRRTRTDSDAPGPSGCPGG